MLIGNLVKLQVYLLIKIEFIKPIIIIILINFFYACSEESLTSNISPIYENLNCDIDTTFSKVLPGTAGYDIIKSSDCGYVISGSTGKTVLMKIDENGNELWSVTYGGISGSHWGNSVKATSDGGYIIGAAQNTIIKTDSLGVEEWHKKLSYSVHHYVEDVIQISNGDYLVIGGAGGDPLGGHAIKGKAFLLKMSEGGGVQWIKRYGIIDTPNNSFWGVVEADDGGFVLAGEKLQDRNFEFYDHFWVLKTDAYGVEEWSIESGGNLWDEAKGIVKLSDDSYIVTGKTSLSSTNINMKVMRISSSGQILWQNNHGGGNNDTGTAITLSQNEEMVTIAGYTRSSSGSPFNYRIWGVDAESGQILWSKIYGGNQEDKAFGVVESYDNGFNIIGRSYSFGTERVNWIVKTDSFGDL